MTVVEMSASGVVWAIGSDRSAWVYNGGYGNELSRGMPASVFVIVDFVHSFLDYKK